MTGTAKNEIRSATPTRRLDDLSALEMAEVETEAKNEVMGRLDSMILELLGDARDAVQTDSYRKAMRKSRKAASLCLAVAQLKEDKGGYR